MPAKKKSDKEKLLITKVGRKGENTFVHAETNQGGEIIQTVLDCDAPPLPEFEKALSDLGRLIASKMSFPKDWIFKTISASVNYEEDGRRGVTCHLLVTLPNFDKPISINSPHMREKIVGAGGGGTFMTPTILEHVDDVVKEGQKYLEGDRAQRELLPDDEDEPTGEEE